MFIKREEKWTQIFPFKLAHHQCPVVDACGGDSVCVGGTSCGGAEGAQSVPASVQDNTLLCTESVR